MREGKKAEGGGAFKAPPDRIGLRVPIRRLCQCRVVAYLREGVQPPSQYIFIAKEKRKKRKTVHTKYKVFPERGGWDHFGRRYRTVDNYIIV